MDALQELRALSKLIQDAIDTIEVTVKASDLEFPSPHTPFTIESEKARTLPDVQQASSLIVAAAMQLIQSVRSPTLSILTIGMQVCAWLILRMFSLGLIRVQHTLCSALNTAIMAHVAEVCRDAGPHVRVLLSL